MPKPRKRGKGVGRRERWRNEFEAQQGKDVQFTKPAIDPEPKPRSPMWRHKGKFAAAGSAALAGSTLYAYHRHHEARRSPVSKYYDPFSGETVEFEKADQPEASTGRKALGTVAAGWHGAFVGRKGHKTRAVGNEVGGAMLGATPGYFLHYAGVRSRKPAFIAAGRLASMTGSYGGAWQGTKRAHRMGHYKPENVGKAERKASTGRQFLGAWAPGWHGAIAGRKGSKLRAAGNELGGNLVGSLPGRVILQSAARSRNPVGVAAGSLSTMAGGFAGGVVGTRRAQRMGHYKREKVGKAFARNAFANQPVTAVAALVPTGRSVSRANALSVTRHRTERSRTSSPVLHVRRGR